MVGLLLNALYITESDTSNLHIFILHYYARHLWKRRSYVIRASTVHQYMAGKELCVQALPGMTMHFLFTQADLSSRIDALVITVSSG